MVVTTWARHCRKMLDAVYHWPWASIVCAIHANVGAAQSVMSARHTQEPFGRHGRAPMPAAAPWGRANRWVTQADGKSSRGTRRRRRTLERTRESAGVDWRTTSDDVTLPELSPGPLAFGSRPSMRSLSTFTDRRATACKSQHDQHHAGDRSVNRRNCAKPTTEMSSGMCKPVVRIACITPEASMWFSARARTPESNNSMALTPSLRCHMPIRRPAEPIKFDASSSSVKIPFVAAQQPTFSPGCTPTTATRRQPGRGPGARWPASRPPRWRCGRQPVGEDAFADHTTG